jgi:hypothetical protein
MFPFGSFLSGIPLVVLAAAYFIYFGATVFNKVKSEDVSFAGNDKAKIVETEPVTSTGKTIHFNKLLTCDSGILNAINNSVFLDFPEGIVHYFPDRNILSYSLSFTLFSRPPPVYL